MPEASDWQKGGIRYAKLQQVIPKHFAPEEVEAFFVGVKGAGRLRLFDPFTPLRREFAVVATPNGATVLKLKLPGVFRASIKETVFDGSGADVSWDGDRMTVGSSSYRPISFHAEDAETVMQLLTGGDSGSRTP